VLALRPGPDTGLRGRLARGDRVARIRPDGRGPWIEVPVVDGGFEVRGLPVGAWQVYGVGTFTVAVGRVTEAGR
jgi:hypothetical protein